MSLTAQRSVGAVWVALALALGASSTGCRQCRLEHTQVEVPLDEDDMGKPCEEICGEVVNLLSDFTGCSEGSTDAGDPAAVCNFELEVCPSNSF